MPTSTFTLAASGDDAFTAQSSTAGEFPPAGTPTFSDTDGLTWTTRELVSGVYTVRCGLQRWSSAALPDGARVASAYIRFYLEDQNLADDDSKLAADWYSWVGSTADHTNDGSPGTAIIGYPIQALSRFAYNNVPLDDLSGISLTGTTSMRFRNTGGTPTFNNRCLWPSYDNAGVFTRPQLVVTYTVPVTLVPDSIAASTNFTGSLSAVTDDPDAPDGTWLTAP